MPIWHAARRPGPRLGQYDIRCPRSYPHALGRLGNLHIISVMQRSFRSIYGTLVAASIGGTTIDVHRQGGWS